MFIKDLENADNCNCLPSNLEILCPNCHSLEETYQGSAVKVRRRNEIIDRGYDGRSSRS